MIGHSLKEDFNYLKLNENEYKCELRDVACFSAFQRSYMEGGGKRKLKDLARDFLNAEIQTGQHSSIIDARIALALYRAYQLEIEIENQVNPSISALSH